MPGIDKSRVQAYYLKIAELELDWKMGIGHSIAVLGGDEKNRLL